MQEFIAKHQDKIAGTLSGFDRLVFRGHLRSIGHPRGMMTYLWFNQVLLKNFGHHVAEVTERLKEASLAEAKAYGRGPALPQSRSTLSGRFCHRRRLHHPGRTAPAAGTTPAMARPPGACPPSLKRGPGTAVSHQPRRGHHQRLPQPPPPRHVLPQADRRHKGDPPALCLDQPQTPLAAGPRPDHQDHWHTPLSANFYRSQDHCGYPQCSTIHACPAHARDSSTNSRRRIDAMKKIFANGEHFEG